MANLIIICGQPGSGKTTLANALAKELGWVCLHKDSIKETLYDQLGGKNLSDSKRFGKAAIFTLYRLVEEQLELGANLIVESPFNFEADYPIITSWRDHFGANIVAFECDIDETERLRRYKERPRHVSHHDTDRLIAAGSHEEHQPADYKKIPGYTATVVTDKPVHELVHECCAILQRNK